MDNNDKIVSKTWKDTGFDRNLARPVGEEVKTPDYLGGAKFDAKLDELMLNRIIRLKNLDKQPQGNNDVGKIYYDRNQGKAKMWTGAVGKWADIVYTSTSTTTTSTSTTT